MKEYKVRTDKGDIFIRGESKQEVEKLLYAKIPNITIMKIKRSKHSINDIVKTGNMIMAYL